ncbi:amino acid adenylation domain-containing protein [Streptomyces harbinensis]|uniref:amino acid adenylation domain-containing protein n=1 Tax=Streptomyces harbinensis TaxID=1176198 RepID=UPI003398CB6A
MLTGDGVPHSGESLATEAVAAGGLGEALAWQAGTRPTATAFRFPLFPATPGSAASGPARSSEPAGETTLDYATLDARARSVAAALAAGHTPGDRVLILTPPGEDFVVSFFGCLYADLVPVPLAARLNSRFARTVAGIAADAAASTAVTSADLAAHPAVRELTARLGLTVHALDTLATAAPDTAPRPASATLAFLQYTSGTTRSPRGVEVTHANLLDNLRTIRRAFALTSDSVMAGWLPPHHDMGLIGTVLLPVYLGIPSTLMDPAAFIRNPARWLTVISRYGATVSGGPDFAYDLCLRRVRDEDRARLDLSGWRVAFNGAEPVRPATLDAFAERFAGVGFDRRAFLPCYGLAEATLLVAGRHRTEGPHRAVFDRARLTEGHAVPAPAATGREIAGYDILPEVPVAVVDDAGHPLPDGRVGEIWCAGGGVARGYRGDPDSTGAVFGARPAGRHETFLRTGDLGIRIGDLLYVVGRRKDVLPIRGRNHDPSDIEATIAAACAGLGVGRVAVFAVDREDGPEAVVAVCEMGEQRPAPAAEIGATARAAVAEAHGLALWRVAAVQPRTIPVTTSGKIRRAACASAFLSGEPPFDAAGEPAGPDPAPVLRAAVSRLLEIPPDRVTDRTSLGALGLDSVRALELQHVIEEHTGRRPPLEWLTGSRTLGELAAGIADIGKSTAGRPGGPPGDSPEPGAADGVVAEDGTFPLSAGQRAISFENAVAPGTASLNLTRLLRLQGPLDPHALRGALDHVLRRHPALRTACRIRDGETVQHITAVDTVPLETHDAADWTPERLAAAFEAAATQPFAPDAPPLLRATLVRRASPDTHELLLCAHHSVMDVRSLTVLVGDLLTRYRALAEGRDSGADPPAPDAHPADFVRRQRALAEGPEGAAHADYWRGQLAAADPVDLPGDRPATGPRTFAGAAHAFRLDRAERDRLAAFAADCGTTLPTALFTAFSVLLGRYARRDTFRLGYVHSGRTHARFADLVGYHVNVLPVPVTWAADDTVRTLTTRLAATLTQGFDHADYPVWDLAGTPPARPAAGPWLTATYAYQRTTGTAELGLTPLVMNHSGELGEWAGLRVGVVPAPHRASHFDLSLHAAEHDGEVLATLEYSTERFDVGTVQVLARVLRTLLREMTDGPDRPVRRLQLLDTEEHAQITGAWNDTATDDDIDTPVHHLIEARAAEEPDGPAVVDGDLRLTRAELNRAANRLAHRLIAAGVGPESRVGLLVERSAQSLIAVLAVLKAGGAYVPLDPAYPLERRAFMLDDAGARLLIAPPRLAADHPDLTALDPGAPDLAAEPDTDPGPRAWAGNTAYVVYTSGSTGTPHGVLGLHRGITNRQRWIASRFPMATDEVGSHKTALAFFDSGGEMFLPLCSGRPLVIVPESTGRDPVRLAELLERHRVTRLVAVPSLLRSMLDSCPDLGRRLSALRYCHSSGEALPRDLAARLLTALPHCALIDLYGSSEVSADVTLHRLDDPDAAGTVGTPLGNTRVYVLDDGLDPLPPRFAGEVYIGGAGLARGYLGKPGRTADRFRPDPFRTDGARIFRTGDRGRFREDGALELLGRADDQVQIRGFRVELGEVQAALLDQPAVRSCVVSLDAGSGEGDDAGPAAGAERLVGLVVPDPAHLAGARARAVKRHRERRLGEWRDLYDRMYADAGPEQRRQSAIWTSSLTGAPFTDPEMSEWIDNAVARVRALRPHHLLEIGCGTGNLLLALAPDCEHCTGTDFSAAALDVTRTLLADSGAGDRVTLLHREAHDLDDLPAGSYDTVVLNSVAQYFPDAAYLRQVLSGAVRLTAPGGRIFVGDVRDADLLDLFHTSVVLATDPGARRLPPDALRHRVRRRAQAEEELAAGRRLFTELAAGEPAITHVEFHLKRGRHHNELTAFRYDVILHVDTPPRPLPDPLRRDWRGDGLDLTGLRALLTRARPRPVEVRSVPNARLWGIPGAPAGDPGVDPEDVHALAAALGWEVAVTPAAEDRTAMDLWFRKPGDRPAPGPWVAPAVPADGAHANDPLLGAARRDVLADIRTGLRRRLPEFMIPVLDLVDDLPRTDTGKVSRRAVRAALGTRTAAPAARTATGGAPGDAGMEPSVTRIWQAVLGQEGIGPHDNFFDIGGNSLSLVQVHLRLQELAGVEFPLVELYERATVRDTARYLAHLEAAGPVDPPAGRPRGAQHGESAAEDRRRRVAARRHLLRDRLEGGERRGEE